MRRFVVFAALLGLTACGGPMTPEEEGAPGESQSAARGDVDAQGVGGCGLYQSPECVCDQYRSSMACTQAQYGNTRCRWNEYSRCVPTSSSW